MIPLAASHLMPNPGDALFITHDAVDTDETKRNVRSRAAQHSHRVGPRKPKHSKRSRATASKQKDEALSEQQPDTTTSFESPPAGDDCSPDDAKPESSSATSSRRPSTVASEHSQQSSAGSSGPSSTPRATANPNLTRQPSAIVARSAHYPVEPRQIYPYLLNYMWPWMLRSWRHLDTTNAERVEALQWVQQLTLNDPTYFYMNMLSVADSLCDQGRLDHRPVLWLSGRVVATLNLALRNPQSVRSAGTILTVGRIALREIVVGDRHVGSTIHRPAQVRLIAMAGGVPALNLPSLVVKHILWSERLIASITGITMSDLDPLALPPDFARQHERPFQHDLVILKAYRPGPVTPQTPIDQPSRVVYE